MNKLIIPIIAVVIIATGIGVFVFQKSAFPEPQKQTLPQAQNKLCGDGICQDIEKERGVCEDCKISQVQKTEEGNVVVEEPKQSEEKQLQAQQPTQQQTTTQTKSVSQSSKGDNSLDADGFLWGTETYPNLISQTASTIKETLKIKYVKIRLQSPMFTKDGKTFTAKVCMPSQSMCLKQYDLDAAVKLFKENSWSMMPMLSHDFTSDKSIDAIDIDNFVNFADWLVSRYKNDANIKYVELINSPASLWDGTDEQLVELSNKTYDRIKNKYPDIMIGTPGFEYWNDIEGDKGVRQLEYFLDKNNGAKFDFMAFHGYPTAVIGKSSAYPPTMKAKYNKLAGIYGLLEIRNRINENGWGNRLIIDTEHTGLFPTKPSFTENEYKIDAAFMVQELLVKKTLRLNDKSVLSGVSTFKIASRGTVGEFIWASLKADGSITPAIKAVSFLMGKFNEYNYSSHISGEWDAESTPWIEKFTSGDNKELYIFFKLFKYASDKSISLDNETVNYVLSLNKTPKSITITDVDGNVSNITASKTVTLQAVNAPKYLEVEY